ncbi:MAG: SIMPL domain-containing protein [Chloroflexota bacterium]
MESQRNSNLLALGIILAFAFVVSAFLISGAVRTLKRSDQTVSVTGYAERTIKSDKASWSFTISARSGDQSSAYDLLQSDKGKAMQYLASKGISSDLIQSGSVITMPVFRISENGNPTGIIDGYQLDQTFTVNSKDIYKIKDLAVQAAELLRQGVTINSQAPQYYYSKINDLKVDMLGEAVRNAKQRAEQIARNSGDDIGSIISARQGVFQITPENSTEVSDYGINDMTSIVKVIKSVVSVDFRIE